MRRFVLRRAAYAVVSLFLLSVTIFLFVRVTGDPTVLLVEPGASKADLEALRMDLGLDRSLVVQYGTFMRDLLRGDFGRSFAFERPALTVVLERMPATLELAGAAVALGIVFGVPAGMMAARLEGMWLDRAVMAVVLVGQSVPTFWLGLLMIRVFAVDLHWLPVSGRGSWGQLVMPAVALALWLAALLARITRSEMLESLAQDYVRTARAKGLSEPGVTIRHALGNALLPIVTLIGLQIGTLLGGAVITETVFAWPGLGTLVFDAILRKDYPVVLAVVELVAAGFIAINMSLDLLYGYLDPRLRRAGA